MKLNDVFYKNIKNIKYITNYFIYIYMVIFFFKKRLTNSFSPIVTSLILYVGVINFDSLLYIYIYCYGSIYYQC